MLRKFVFVLAGALACAGAAGAAPLEAYGKLPLIEEVKISPNGDLIAYVMTNGDQRRIAVQTVSDLKIKLGFQAGMQKVRDLQWAGDDHLILTMSTTRQPEDVISPRVERYLAEDLNLKTGRTRIVLQNVQQPSIAREPTHLTLNTILGSPQVRQVGGKPAVFVTGVNFVNNDGQSALFRVDLDRGEDVLVDPGGGGAYDWLISAQGEPFAKAYYRDDPGTWKLMVRPSHGPWRVVETRQASIETPDIVGMGRNENSVLVEDSRDKGSVWRELSVETGAWSEPEAASDGLDAIHDPVTGRLIGGAALIGDDWSYTFFDAHDAAVWRAVSKAFGGDAVTLASWSDDRKKIIVRVDSPGLAPAYSLVDTTTGQATWLAEEYDGLKSGDVSPVKAVRYKAADGLEISGYLTLPRGKDAHGLPLVVLPHGGPHVRDEPGFDWWAQALASRGYAVLQPNYRGSAGLGRAFMEAGFGEFGRKMQTDLSDGVRDLARQGVIDAKRVCIVGASYGGYAALAGAALDRGVYRCAVSYAGPADMRALIDDSREKGGRSAPRFWERYMGAKDLDDSVLAKISPALHAADVDIPVLLIHGKDDTVVPISQSRRMAQAMRAAGKPVELIELNGEDHWLSTGATRLAMLQATVAFLEKNNPPH